MANAFRGMKKTGNVAVVLCCSQVRSRKEQREILQGRVFQMMRQTCQRSSREKRAELFFLTNHCLEKQQAACIDIKPQLEIERVLI